MLAEELKLYPEIQYPAKIKNPKTLCERMRHLAMLRSVQTDAIDIPQSNDFLFDAFELNMIDKIFDLSKPIITDKDFIKFASSEVFKGKLKVFKTKSGYAVAAVNGHMCAEHDDENTAGTHWNHGSKRDGLDWHFVANVRDILSSLGVKPR